MLRNKCILDLNGQSGDDAFTVRSFIAVIDSSGELLYNETGKVSLTGGSTECEGENDCNDGGDGKSFPLFLPQ